MKSNFYRTLTKCFSLTAITTAGCNLNVGTLNAKVADSASATLEVASNSVQVTQPTLPSPIVTHMPEPSPTVEPTLEPGEIRILEGINHDGLGGSSKDNLFVAGSIYNATGRKLLIAAKKFRRSPGADPLKATLVNMRFATGGILWPIGTSNGDLVFDPQKTVFEIPAGASVVFKIAGDAQFAEVDREELHAHYVGFIVDQDSFEIVGGGKIIITPFTGRLLYCNHLTCIPQEP